MKITKDGFVWLTVHSEKAVELWQKKVFSLFLLYDDDSEGLIESEAQLTKAIANGWQIGIEVGQIENFKEQTNQNKEGGTEDV